MLVLPADGLHDQNRLRPLVSPKNCTLSLLLSQAGRGFERKMSWKQFCGTTTRNLQKPTCGVPVQRFSLVRRVIQMLQEATKWLEVRRTTRSPQEFVGAGRRHPGFRNSLQLEGVS